MRLEKAHSVLPGFRLTMGFTVFYLSLVVLIPLSTLFWKSASLGASGFWQAVTAPRVLASYKLTFGASLVAASVNGFPLPALMAVSAATADAAPTDSVGPSPAQPTDGFATQDTQRI